MFGADVDGGARWQMGALIGARIIRHHVDLRDRAFVMERLNEWLEFILQPFISSHSTKKGVEGNVPPCGSRNPSCREKRGVLQLCTTQTLHTL